MTSMRDIASQHAQVFGTNEAASLSGVSVSSVKMYAREGIVTPSVRGEPGRGRERLYSTTDIAKLAMVDHFRRMGFSLALIGQILEDLSEGIARVLRGEAGGEVVVRSEDQPGIAFQCNVDELVSRLELAARATGLQADAATGLGWVAGGAAETGKELREKAKRKQPAGKKRGPAKGRGSK